MRSSAGFAVAVAAAAAAVASYQNYAWKQQLEVYHVMRLEAAKQDAMRKQRAVEQGALQSALQQSSQQQHDGGVVVEGLWVWYFVVACIQ